MRSDKKFIIVAVKDDAPALSSGEPILQTDDADVAKARLASLADAPSGYRECAVYIKGLLRGQFSLPQPASGEN